MGEIDKIAAGVPEDPNAPVGDYGTSDMEDEGPYAITVYYAGEYSPEGQVAVAQRAVDALAQQGIMLQNPQQVEVGPEHPGEPASTWTASPEMGNFVQITADNIDEVPDDLEIKTPELEIFKDPIVTSAEPGEPEEPEMPPEEPESPMTKHWQPPMKPGYAERQHRQAQQSKYHDPRSPMG